MMPDYMEALVSQLGLEKVLDDLHKVVLEMANGTNDKTLWLLEQDLYIVINELKNGNA